ncbi:MAG TPA: hypothetical protein ENK65_03150 [Helicobacteraceae bacterium]|nr:hypothetical protein [Helicobacteraceae bacterium]
MHQAYRLSIFYFTLFALLLLTTGTFLFLSKIGLSIDDINNYYAGNAALFINAKSSYGQLETAVPHLGGMGLFIMVMGHFLLFASKKTKKSMHLTLILLFITALLDIVSGFLISAGFYFFTWVKLSSFILLIGLALFLTLLIQKEAFLGFKNH